jgi:hypothetical protein
MSDPFSRAPNNLGAAALVWFEDSRAAMSHDQRLRQ